MSRPEYLECFDENMQAIGVHSRTDVHTHGYWHQTVQFWVVRQEGDARYVVFQRRGAQKDLFPNQLDATAAGHLVAGETPVDGIRELHEELGLDCSADQLIPLGIKTMVCRYGPLIDREFLHVFLVKNDRPLERYELQPSEVLGLVQIEIGEGLRFFAGEVGALAVDAVRLDASGHLHRERTRITEADIPHGCRSYYATVLIMAERYLEGRTYLSI